MADSGFRDFRNSQTSLASTLGTRSMGGYGAALDYYLKLLQGGPQAQMAVGPYVEQLRQLYAGTEKNIQNSLPAGGEKNAALARLPIQRAGDISRLYSGMGMQAAGGLGQLSLGGLGAASNIGSNIFGYEGQREQAKGALWGGLLGGAGSILGGWLGGR